MRLIIVVCLVSLVALFQNCSESVQQGLGASSSSRLLLNNNNNSPYIYNYAPTVILDQNKKYIWTCSNVPTPGVFSDVIGYFVNDVYAVAAVNNSNDKTSWDGVHACDPSVIKGNFKFNNKSYGFLMAYLGEDFNDVNGDGQVNCNEGECSMHNQVGVAYANSIDGPWTKYAKNPILPYSDRKTWGIGQPSLIKLQNGKILLFYTKGSSSKTSVYYKIFDFSNVTDSSPPSVITSETEMLSEGLTTNSSNIVLRNADFVTDSSYSNIYMLRGSETDDRSYVQIAGIKLDDLLSNRGQWTVLKNIDESVTGAKNNHNAGFVRTADGFLSNSAKLTVVVTTDTGTPSQPEKPRIEWDYALVSTEVLISSSPTTSTTTSTTTPPPGSSTTTTSTTVPPTSSPVVITSPSNGSTGVSQVPSVSWSYGGSATEFWMDLSESSTFNSFWNRNFSISARSYNYSNNGWGKSNTAVDAPAALISGKKYYLRITPFKNGAAVGNEASQVVSFTVANVNSPVSISSPVNGAVGVGLLPTINWSYNGAGTELWMDLSESPTFDWFWNRQLLLTANSYTYMKTGWGQFNTATNPPSLLSSVKRYYLRIVPFKNGVSIPSEAMTINFQTQ